MHCLGIIAASMIVSAAAALADTAPDAIRRATEADWMAQDGYKAGEEARAIEKVLGELKAHGLPAPKGPSASAVQVPAAVSLATPEALRAKYIAACEARRAARLQAYLQQLRRVIFTKHFDMGGSHYAYTEGQSDAQAERHFKPGTALCVLAMEPSGPQAVWPRVYTLLTDANGVIRDPDVSWDGRRVLFAWKRDDRKDDYHLYEAEVVAGEEGDTPRLARPLRQLTDGLGFADYEACYLPDGTILFNSTRCVQTVDCWWTEVSNLYACGADGRFLRRVSYDQVHTNYPTVTSDGRVIYTRWDYNDRGQIYPQGLFQMNPDGTAQTELYGNNSWFPTTLLHARAIPGTGTYVAIATGHHTRQNGWLCIVDPQRGRQENSGVQLVAPLRDTPAVRMDAYGQSGSQFQYPYPLCGSDGTGGKAFLVAMKPAGAGKGANFAIYWVDVDARRELLACDEKISCNQPAPLAPRPRPHPRADLRDYHRHEGTVYLQDIYAGGGLAGVARGAVRKLRVVALDFRAAGVDNNNNAGPAGGALVSTPVSIQGSWDVKIVLGEADVAEDGSACFTVPAKTALYFQAIDANGCAVQTMRSWATLQPGESVSCAGCHEDKNTAPPTGRTTLAMKRGPRELTPFGRKAGEGPRGFSFHREIQPILDRHCVKCHFLAPKAPGPAKRGKPADEARQGLTELAGSAPASADLGAGVKPAFSLKGAAGQWSDAYKALASPKVCSWISVQSEPSMLPPYHAGAARSKLVRMLAEGHNGVKLSRDEQATIACWIDLLVPCFGDYAERNLGDRAKYERFLNKRHAWLAQEHRNVAEYLLHVNKWKDLPR